MAPSVGILLAPGAEASRKCSTEALAAVSTNASKALVGGLSKISYHGDRSGMSLRSPVANTFQRHPATPSSPARL
jgi:hypothetical protein